MFLSLAVECVGSKEPARHCNPYSLVGQERERGPTSAIAVRLRGVPGRCESSVPPLAAPGDFGSRRATGGLTALDARAKVTRALTNPGKPLAHCGPQRVTQAHLDGAHRRRIDGPA